MKLPPCGTCGFAIKDGSTLWCHGGPPTAWQEKMVQMKDGNPEQVTVTKSAFAPVHDKMVGCAVHTKLGRKG